MKEGRCKWCNGFLKPNKSYGSGYLQHSVDECQETRSAYLSDHFLEMDRAHNSGYCKCQEACFSGGSSHNCSETCDHCFDIKEGIMPEETDDRDKFLMALVAAQKQSKEFVEIESARQKLIAFLEKVPHECSVIRLMTGVSRYSSPDAFWPIFKDVPVPEEAHEIIEKHLNAAFAEIRETFLPRVTQ